MNEVLQKQLAEMDSDALDRAYMEVFNSGLGPLVLEDLRNRCYEFASTLDENPQISARNEGMRCVLLMIRTRLRPIKQEQKQEEQNVIGHHQP
jgi:hypothetical protein